MAGATAPLSTLEVYINNKPLVQAAKAGAQSTKMLGNSMRMLGRDILRLGGVIGKYGAMFNKIFGMMKTASFDLGGAVEDASWAIEDIMAEVGDALTPIFEYLADVLDIVADIFEGLPTWMKMAIGLFVVGSIVTITLAQHLMTLYGTMLLVKGAFKGVDPAASKLFATLGRYLGLAPKITAASNVLLETNQRLTQLNKQLGDTQLKYNKALTLGQKDAGKYGIKLTGIKDEIATLEKTKTGLTKAEKKGTKERKKGIKAQKRGMMTIGKSIAILGAFTLLMFILTPLLEAVSPIMEALGEAFEVMFEPLGPIIDLIADWIEENPKLAAGIITGIVLAIGLLLAKKKGLFGFLEGFLTKGGDTLSMVKKGKHDFLQFAAGIALIAISLTPLILALTHFLVQMKEHNITIPEVIGYLFALGGAITFIVGIISVLAVVLAPTLPIMAGFALVLLAAGIAALGFGAGIMLAGKGVEFAAEGLVKLVHYIPQVLVLIPALFALASGFGILGIAAGIFAIAGFGASLAFLGMAAGITALALAISCLATALRGIPPWAQGFIGGLGGVLGGAIGAFPVLQEGGIVRKGGVAILEPAEVVTPAGGRVPSGPSTIYNTFYITATIREEADIDKLTKKVSEKQAESYSGRVFG